MTEEVGALDGVTDVHVDLATGEVDVASTRPLERELVAAASTKPATSWRLTHDARRSTTLDIEGMTCASCVSRVRRR